MIQAARAYVFLCLRSTARVGVAGGAWRVLLALLFVLCFVPGASALPPREIIMDPPTALVENGMVTVRIALTVNDEEGLLALLKDGAVLELAISAVVIRERTLWRNAKAATVSFSSILRHDPLSRDFVALVPTPDGEKEVRDRNLSRLLQASWSRLALPVIPLENLLRIEPAASYLVQLTITLRHIEVPPWLERTSLFWSPEVVPQVKRNFVFTPPPHAEGR